MKIKVKDPLIVEFSNLIGTKIIKVEEIHEYTRSNTKQISGTYGGQEVSLTHKYILTMIGDDNSCMIDHSMLSNLGLFITDVKKAAEKNNITWKVID